MKKWTTLIGLLGVVTVLVASSVYANSQVTDPTTMAVAPSTLVLDCDQADVTIHTTIPYTLVDVGSLSMEGLTPIAAGADTCGDLVLKFAEDAVKALPTVAPPDATFTLTGVLVSGESITLTDTVRVK